MIDTTRLYTVEEVAHTLRERDVVLAAAGPASGMAPLGRLKTASFSRSQIAIYPTLKEAIRVFHETDIAAVAKKVKSANNF
jgi:hypothetical protein